MPGFVPPVGNEKDTLLGYLIHQRYVVRLTAYGLDDEQAREARAPSPLTVGGIVKHLTAVERFWMQVVQQRVQDTGQDDYQDNFKVGDGESLEALFAAYDEAGTETDAIVRALDLGEPVPVPKDVPWFPTDVDAWSVRWVVLHLIEETARHAGHADIVREAIDGATAFPLRAAAEGWPASPWLTPWEPASAAMA
jgi:uncharacterized damage-inducible protein DinB